MTEEKLIEIYGFESPAVHAYKKSNFLGTTDYLHKATNDYYIECYTDIYNDDGECDDDYETYRSDNLSFESLKELLIELYGETPLREYRRKKLERICK